MRRLSVARPGPVLGILLSGLVGRLPAAEPSFADFDRRAREGATLSVVFFGASLTWGANASDPQLTSYRAVVGRRFEERYPQAHFRFWDAAIGGTNSRLGVFRFDRDVLRRKPDLVFLDFSANDDIYSATPETLASYESLVRRIILDAHAPVVQVIFPFQWDVAKGSTRGMQRRDAHLAIAKAYHAAVGDAIDLAQQRVRSGETTLAELWPVDGVHPCDRGYELFADAAWDALGKAIRKRTVCAVPHAMLYAPTYTANARVRLATLGPLPRDWRIGKPKVVSAYFDMLMSRWLDGEIIAAGKGTADGQPAPLRVRFRGSMVMLYGESTPASGKYRAVLDGKAVQRKSGDGKPLPPEFDAADFAKRVNGNAYLVQVLAEGLDPTLEHSLEIQPAFAGDTEQELRLESVCVAGGKAEVRPARAGGNPLEK
ncbi:MAG: SGNH/GDSL hydrolase family protein [Thermoguttaceae bacterium]|jgi:lysophospholipase L1-like esterase